MYTVFFKTKGGQTWCKGSTIVTRGAHIIVNGIAPDIDKWIDRLQKGLIAGFDIQTDGTLSITFAKEAITGMFNEGLF